MDKFILDTPRGTRDYDPKESKLREHMLDTIKSVYKAHDAVPLETPIYEYRHILMNKYGEEQKLIFDLAQGEDKDESLVYSLRYDLTVPLTRYLATTNAFNIKSYQIGEVFRRDTPSITNGRMRQFTQCDFDIAGNYDSMIPDAETISVMVEILDKFGLDYKIKFNHKVLLDQFLILAGIANDKVATVCSSIDKLDKHDWEYISKELGTKGISEEQINGLYNFVKISGKPLEILGVIRAMTTNAIIIRTLDEIELLFGYLEKFSCLDKVVFDLSLARGLSYYTGIIFEAVNTKKDVDYTIGSIGAGGRYDCLVESFNEHKHVPIVGCSIGFTRIFTILSNGSYSTPDEKRCLITTIENKADVTKNKTLLLVAMEIANNLWKADISTELYSKSGIIMKDKLKYALDKGVKFMILIAENEYTNGEVVVKNLATKQQYTIKIDQVIDFMNHGQK